MKEFNEFISEQVNSEQIIMCDALFGSLWPFPNVYF